MLYCMLMSLLQLGMALKMERIISLVGVIAGTCLMALGVVLFVKYDYRPRRVALSTPSFRVD